MVILTGIMLPGVSPAPAALHQPLTVKNDNSFSYSQIPVTGGIPLPLNLNVTSPAQLNISDSQGNILPSQFQVTARWGGAPDESGKPIKWLLATFPADIESEGSSTYYLSDGAGNQTSSGLAVVSNTADELVKIGRAHV